MKPAPEPRQPAVVEPLAPARLEAKSAMILVLGVGNPERGDDGAGRAVARRLLSRPAPGLVARELSGEAMALVSACENWDDVVIVDAALGPTPGRVARFDAAALALPAPFARASTHGAGVAEAVELMRALGRLPRALTVYAIAGRDFGLGQPLSAEVARAVKRVTSVLRRSARA